MTRTRQEHLRLGLLFTFVIICFVVFAARLAHLQLYLNQRYSAVVSRQSTGKLTIPAERGLIYDRNGQVVAKNVIGCSLYAFPENAAEVDSVGRYLDRLFHFPAGVAEREYKLSPHKFRWIKRRLGDAEARQIEADAQPGLHIRKESQREYPFGLVGKQIIGFTDIDNQGQSSFELTYDSAMQGQSGLADIRRDGLRNTYRVNEEALLKPVPGTSLVLTVDWHLQDIVEQELKHAVDTFDAETGMAVFLDCRSGEILAMAHYDPNEKDRERPTKLRAISDQFEPGSVFKAFTAAGVLDGGPVNFGEQVYCENGAWKVGRRTLHDDKKHGWLNFREIIELSSNIGIAKWAIRRDGGDLYDMYRRFGFGKRSKCGLPGEAAGRLVPPSRWSDFNIAQTAMGHSIAVTTLQLARAFGSIANGGEIIHPQILLGQVDKDGHVVPIAPRESAGSVMHNGTLDSLKAFLRGVVENGTAKVVNSKVVEIAGKTGTAELPDLETGRYFKNRFVGSFAGFFPYQSPLIAGAVMLINPQPVHYGGLTSGPTFRRIAERYAILNPDLYAVTGGTLARKEGGLDSMLQTPSFVGRDVSLVATLAEARGIKLRSAVAEGTVVWQFPPPGRLMFRGDDVMVAATSTDGAMRMPDMTGLPVNKVFAFLTHAKVAVKVKGAGKVVSQSVPAGEVITSGMVCQLECQSI